MVNENGESSLHTTIVGGLPMVLCVHSGVTAQIKADDKGNKRVNVSIPSQSYSSVYFDAKDLGDVRDVLSRLLDACSPASTTTPTD